VIRSAFIVPLLLLAWACSYAAVVPIQDIKVIDANGEIIPDLVGRVFTVTGVVTVPAGAFNTTDLDIYVQDHTAGINVLRPGGASIRLGLGDSVVVTGVLDQLNGNTLLRVQADTDIEKIGSGTLPKPVVVTAADLGTRPQPPLELYEGKLVIVEAVTFNPADWPAAGVNKTISASDPTGALQFTIDRDTGIGGTDAPRQPTILIGVVIQNDSRWPYLQNYVVWPRSRYGDFYARGNGSGTVSLVPDVVETGTESFDLEITVAGNSVDTITHFSIDLPLADGWEWPAESGNVRLSGPGLAGADFQVTASGVMVAGAAILDGESSYGRVTLKGISAPSVRIESEVVVQTSLDGTGFVEVALPPVLKALYPIPDVVINEVYPHDGTTQQLNSFVELYNKGTATARLEGFAYCEQKAVSYCSQAVKHVFGASDTIPPGGYLVLVASTSGFNARFGLEPPLEQPPVEAGISPLGRIEGDGGTCGSARTYELLTLWRDDTLRDLVAYREYADASVCTGDLCSGFGGSDDAFPYIPPVGYSLLYGRYDPCCPYQLVSADPTPGAPNVTRYGLPFIKQVKSYDKRTIEVTFNQPMDAARVEAPLNYVAQGQEARAAQLSLSGEKVLVLFRDLAGFSAVLRVSGVASAPGVVIRDTSLTVTLSTKTCPALCEIQASDDQGFSPFGGETVCALGFVTVPPGVFQPDYSSIYVQGLDGCGINVFSYDVPQPRPVVGDFVSVTGEVTDYVSGSGAGATTEIFMSAASGLAILSRGYPQPDPLVLSTAEVSREINEGRLIQTQGAVVKADSVASFYIDDGSGGIQIYQNYTSIDFTKYEIGMYVRVRGVVLQYDYTAPFLEGYELVPRYLSDIEIIEGAFPAKAALDVDARVFCPSCGDQGFRIGFTGPDRSNIVLRIFDSAGRDVITLYDGSSAGAASVTWDGRDHRGEKVPPGLYICYLECVEAGSSRRMTDSAPIVVGMELK
jgi:hypothetical protein